MLCFVTLCLGACDSRSDKEKNFVYPSSSDHVTSNGGLAVHKGNYAYLVNGFTSVNNSEKGKSYTHSGLMLVKFDEHGDIIKDKDGLIEDETFIYLTNQLAGFEATNLFVSGDYLYFTTQSQENYGGEEYDKNVWAKEIVVFNRIKLDKSGSVEKLYQSGAKSYTENGSEIEFKYYESEGKVHLVVFEKGDVNKLVKVTAGEKTHTIENVVSSTLSDNAEKIFYVQNVDEEQKLFQFNAKNNTSTDFELDFSSKEELTLKFASERFVYLTFKDGEATKMQAVSIATKNISTVIYDTTSFGEICLQYSDIQDCLLVVQSNKIIIYVDGVMKETISDASATSIDILGFTNASVVYLDNSNNIKIVNYVTRLQGGNSSIDLLAKEVANINKSYFDIAEDSNYMYFYNKINETEYLHRIKVINYSTEQTPEMIGELLDSDKPKTEE